MSISAVEIAVPTAEHVTVTDDTLSVDLSDGRTISVPLVWFPRLVHATPEERDNWRLIGRGHGIHWEDIDENIGRQAVRRNPSIVQEVAGEASHSPNQALQGTR
jgi:hypothetical protein